MAARINNDIANNRVDNKSFALLRTNPKLTTNAKLIVDSESNLFLSSFRASKELSSINYQQLPVNPAGVYSRDLAQFYRDIPLVDKYSVLRQYSDITVFSDYQYQYEEQYQYGAIHNSSKLYNEQYRIFAPIWLEKKIPSKFVIYRIYDVDYDNRYSEDTAGQNERITEILKNATIVKTFDLGINSPIGKYLNNHINDKLFPESAITVNFREGAESTFNGIDLDNGGFAKKAEQLDRDYTQVDYPEFFSNNIITQGFERNNLAIANIINLEFMFDDQGAENYNIYRYFGVYVDELEEGYFKSDGLSTNGQININLNSYKTLYNLEGTTPSLLPVDMIPKESEFDVPVLRWVKDKNDNFYNLIGSHTVSAKHSFKINTNGTNRDAFEGYKKSGKKISFLSSTPNYRGFIKFTIIDKPATNDLLFIGDKTEMEISKYQLGDYLLRADGTIPAGRAIENRFSNQGSLQQIAIAVASAIENGEIVPYPTKVIGTSVIVEDFMAGNQRNQTAFAVYSSNFADFIRIDDGTSNNIGLVDSIVPVGTGTVFSDWDIYTMIGGSIEGQSILVESTEIGNISVGEVVKQKDKEVFIKINEIIKDPFLEETWRVVLNNPVKISNDNLFESYIEYEASHGMFSAYDFKDFDFDRYSTRNSDLGDLLLDEKPTHSGGPNRNIPTFYTGLSGILQQDPVLSTTNELILSEYDRLKENELKETALESRIVPTICKFALVNASNARNLPYILNASEAFGEDNLSPNIEITSKRRVEFLNMEHFHLNNIPTDLYGSRNDFNNYVDIENDGVGLTIDKLTDTTFNYFEAHFNWNGYYDDTSGTWYDNSYKRLWSKFDKGNTQKNSSAVFRGLRYTYKGRKETTKQVPTEFKDNSNINNYKFGVVFTYNNGFYQNGDPILDNDVKFNSIKNDKFGFICVFIELNVVLNNTIDIDRYLLYKLENIEDPTGAVDTTIPFLINFSDSAFDPNPAGMDAPSELRADNSSILDGSADFPSYVTPDVGGEYSWIYFIAIGDVWAVKVVLIPAESSVIVQGWPWKFDLSTGKIDPSGQRLDPSNFSLIPINSQFKYYGGGRNGFGVLLDQVNAGNMANRFNTGGNVNYTTVGVDGTITLDDYVLYIESGVDIIKPSLVSPESDPDRPRAYLLSNDEIGSVITPRKDGGYITLLRRMNGNYNPIFNSIITFSDLYSDNKVIPDTLPNLTKDRVIYNKFNNLGVAFDSYKLNTLNYGYIENYFFHKTNIENPDNVLRLSETTDKFPLYPKIAEVAIDKKDINVFKSKYASDYFTKSLAGFDTELKHGTLSPVEKKNFMASTIMKVKDVYDITRYTNKEENSIEDLDRIRENKTNTDSIHWYEDSSKVTLDVYLPDAIVSELIEDGIYNKFRKYIDSANSFGDKTTILDDLNVYVKENISPRFIITDTSVYGVEAKLIETDFISTNETSELTDDGFKKLTNYNIESYENDGLSFRLIYNKRNGYSYKFKIHVKIEA